MDSSWMCIKSIMNKWKKPWWTKIEWNNPLGCTRNNHKLKMMFVVFCIQIAMHTVYHTSLQLFCKMGYFRKKSTPPPPKWMGSFFSTPPLSPGLGDSRKYPYPTTGGMSILTPPCPRKFQNAYPPPCPPNSKIVNPSYPPEVFHFFFQTFWNSCSTA